MAKSNKVLTVEITNESITIIEVSPSIKKQTNVHNALILKHRKMLTKMERYGMLRNLLLQFGSS